MHRLLLSLLLVLVCAAPAGAEPVAGFTSDEARKILSLGPWPPPARRDPSNHFSGRPDAAAFGRALFFDEGLSRFGALACASCHKPDKAWTDGRARASAAAALDRNTPALLNLRYMRWFGWDGGADTLWMQSIRPLLDPREMAASPQHIQNRITGSPQHRAAYRTLTGTDPRRSPPVLVLVTAAKALAAFQETLVTPRTTFDAFRDGLARGDHTAIGAYPEAARRGLRIFVGRAQCSHCHSGPLLSNGEFYAATHEKEPRLQGAASGRPDTGRADGIAKLKASPYSRLGAFTDDRRRSGSAETRAAIAAPGVEGAFRVPSLRGVALTAPYLHDGSRPTLADAVRHLADAGAGPIRGSTPLTVAASALSASDVDDLVAFINTLSEPAMPKDR